MRRNRAWLAVGIVVVIAVGLASRKFAMFPSVLDAYPGDALWALMVFMIIAFIKPDIGTARLAGAALATAFVVEASQLYQEPWLNAMRATTAGHLVLGTGFQWGDLCAYTIGVAFGLVGDVVRGRCLGKQDISFIRADPLADRADLIALNIEYLSWVFGEVEKSFGVPADSVVGMPVRDYVPTVIDKVCGAPPPKGVFYLVRVNGQLAAMGGLRYLSEQGAEIKRVYVRPAFRGMKLGQLILERLLSDAAAFGYQAAYLDTGLFMTAAHRLYEAHGFVDCPAYEGVEVPSTFHSEWRFMTRELQQHVDAAAR